MTPPASLSQRVNATLRIAAMALLLSGATRHAAAEATIAGEYEVKATFLYNFARFSKWPAGAFAEPAGIRLCIVGVDPFGDAIASVSGKPVGARNLEIARMGASEDARACQIVFIGGGDLVAALEVVRTLEHLPVLTVAEMPDFALSGGTIEFNVVDDRVRFTINPAAAHRHGVTLSSQLLRLAKVVEDRR